MSQFFKEFIQSVSAKYPFFAETLQKHPIPETLISPSTVDIGHAQFNEMESIVKAFGKLRESKIYQQRVAKMSPPCAAYDPGNYSILMSYDFHLTPDGPKLIEINTNAAFGLVVNSLEQFQKSNVNDRVKGDFIPDLKTCILKELKLSGNETLKPDIAIVDYDPQSQNAYFEFGLYNQLFKSWDWNSFIVDPKDLTWSDESQTLVHAESNTEIQYVYNRCCDFLFEDDETQHLKAAFMSGKMCFGPNPHEYSLLAHKQRWINLSDNEFLTSLELDKETEDIIRATIPKTHDLQTMDLDELWKNRKKFFFKPKQLYGSKAVYRGSSISRKVFERISKENFVAQEFVPPSKSDDFKVDMRLYTYRDQIQLAAGRLYQGQVTNVQTLGGGLAAINLID